MAKFAIARPFGVADLRDEFLLDPMTFFHFRSGQARAVTVAFLFRQVDERTVWNANLVEVAIKRAQGSFVEAGSNFAGEKEFFLFVVANEQRAEKFSRGLRVCEAADDELLFVADFKFDPRAGTLTGFVEGIFAFADQTFEAEAARMFEKS